MHSLLIYVNYRPGFHILPFADSLSNCYQHLLSSPPQNATLEAERQAMQAQQKQLESQSDSQQAQILALQRQAASLQ